MKRIVAHALLGLTGLTLAGCPIYPSETQCYDSSDCPSDYYCSDQGYCVRDKQCSDNSDCPADYYCNASGYCVRPGPSTGGSGGSSAGTPCSSPGECGINETCAPDGRCHVGDCSFSDGCVAPYECVLVGYTYTCKTPEQDASTGGAGGSAGSSPDGGDGGTAGTAGASGGAAGTAGQGGQAGTAGSGGAAEAGPPVYCGHPGDCQAGEVCSSAGTCEQGTCSTLGCVDSYHCSTGTPPECLPNNSASCILDDDCVALGATFKCLGGMCTGPADQCVDKTQCPSPDTQSCVEGKCITACSGDADCLAGTHCDTTLGVCTIPAQACTITNDCGDAGLVCVAGACVVKCGAGGVCDAGFVCVANGCVPDTKPEFVCGTEGVQDVCASASICLHHSCYITCTTSPDSCENNPPGLSVCKDVTTSSGQYNVCGSTTNLGSECDPTVAGQTCSGGKVCIDGFCR